MPSIHPSIRPCTKQRRTQPLCMRSLVLNSLEPKKNNNNFHLPREIATRIVKQKAISSHQRNVRCRWFPVDGKKRREEESKQILPDHDADSVRCLHTYSGRIKNYHKTHAQAVVDARHNYRPVGQCVLVQSKRNDTPIGRIICCHSARMAHTHTQRQRAGQKSHTISHFCLEKSGMLISLCSRSRSQRFVVAVVADETQWMRKKEMNAMGNSSDGDAHRIHLLLCVLCHSGHFVTASNTNESSTLGPATRFSHCMRCDNACVSWRDLDICVVRLHSI